jgi:protein gp37
MAENTKISWADHTFNAWLGCTKVSPACDHCYAERWAKTYGKADLWQGRRQRTTPHNWKFPVKWNAKAEKEGIRYRVFCNSLADVFDNEVPEEWRHDLYRLIRATPHLDWLLLTKRIGNVAKMHPGGDYPNVWLGATVINQEEANRDIPKLKIQDWAAKRFVSIEPMLGPVIVPSGLDWVICGGESGHGARELKPEWARSLRDQCAALGVAFHLKQMTKNAPIPEDLMIREFPRNG